MALATILGAGCSQNSSNTASVQEVILARTSIRQYEQRPVEANKVEAMLKAAMAAPTAVNRQPWAFVVIDDRAILDSLAALTKSHQMLAHAPLAIVVCGDMQKALEGEAQPYWIEDCSAAMQNLLLSARGMGLGAVWLGVFPIHERINSLSAALQLPSHIVPLGIASIGYPAETPEPKNKWNPDVVHRNKW